MDKVTSLATLADAASWITPEEVDLAVLLLEENQTHMFEKWTLNADVESKHAFFNQVGEIRR